MSATIPCVSQQGISFLSVLTDFPIEFISYFSLPLPPSASAAFLLSSDTSPCRIGQSPYRPISHSPPSFTHTPHMGHFSNSEYSPYCSLPSQSMSVQRDLHFRSPKKSVSRLNTSRLISISSAMRFERSGFWRR